MSDQSVRRYNEKETRWLLERAGQLERSTERSSRHDLTMPDLESIALESGLDPALLRQAARELDAGKTSVSTKIIGAPLRLVFERTVPFEMSEETFGALLPAIEAAAGGTGQVTRLGRTITWQSRRYNIGRTMIVRISVDDDASTIRVDENFGDLAGGLFGGLLGGVGGGLGIGAGTSIALALNSVALAFALPAFIIGTTFFSARAVYKRYVEKRAAVLQQLLVDIADALSN